MDILNLIISLISGAVGGNVAGATVPTEKNLGTVANTVIGLLGGGAGEYILKALGILSATQTGAADFDWASLLTTIGVSGVSGGAITAIIALIKDAIQKKS